MKVDNMRSTASPLRFKVAGLDCQNEIRALRAAVGPIVGGDDKLSFDTKAGLMEVAVGDPNLVIDITQAVDATGRSEEHTSELQSLMRISYAVFCLKKKKQKQQKTTLYYTPT